MMNFISRSLRTQRVESVRWIESKELPGVRFSVREPSLGNRIDLTQKLHDLTIRNEFLAGGRELQQLELVLAELMVQKALIEWGLVSIEGLKIDGKTPTTQILIESGPEKLVAEIAEAIRARCGLSEEERKN
jgi:hypothetical protein